MSDPRYLLDNALAEAGNRFEVFASFFDPVTFRHMAGMGLGAGWRCWEVGAGGASVPRGLAERVGPTGYVLATDLDVSWAESAAGGVLEVRRHDVAAEPPPAGGFDLVHARLVLVHVTAREQALQHMLAALKPGGWLFIEDADPALQPLVCLDEHGPAEALANKLKAGFRTLLAQRGVDLAYGRKLPRLLREAGLERVRADAYFPVAMPEGAVLERSTIAMVRAGLVENGLATDAEIDAHLANVDAGLLDLATSPMISAWGRKPATGPG